MQLGSNLAFHVYRENLSTQYHTQTDSSTDSDSPSITMPLEIPVEESAKMNQDTLSLILSKLQLIEDKQSRIKTGMSTLNAENLKRADEIRNLAQIKNALVTEDESNERLHHQESSDEETTPPPQPKTIPTAGDPVRPRGNSM